ncbi:hypothetical protein Tco_0716215 [Tanacetum coccineum]
MNVQDDDRLSNLPTDLIIITVTIIIASSQSQSIISITILRFHHHYHIIISYHDEPLMDSNERMSWPGLFGMIQMRVVLGIGRTRGVGMVVGTMGIWLGRSRVARRGGAREGLDFDNRSLVAMEYIAPLERRSLKISPCLLILKRSKSKLKEGYKK